MDFYSLNLLAFLRLKNLYLRFKIFCIRLDRRRLERKGRRLEWMIEQEKEKLDRWG